MGDLLSGATLSGGILSVWCFGEGGCVRCCCSSGSGG